MAFSVSLQYDLSTNYCKWCQVARKELILHHSQNENVLNYLIQKRVLSFMAFCNGGNFYCSNQVEHFYQKAELEPRVSYTTKYDSKTEFLVIVS